MTALSDSKIAEAVQSKKYAHISLGELLKDLKESLYDIVVCEAAIAMGITTYSAGNVQERLDKNKQFVKVIELELERRKNDTST